ncbi:F-box/kelch-repeat protein At3g23880-like [Lycium ferocissimum]|uniref:F-box/kelch-repeat protein At3g23880-like n=1 Tax=Lycium ferocissimum TaxID=112874 RepID=UPI002814F280|nr:F-box/kelch-repeat protein At3g23880-like [Lycium ferocissimum]XP_059277163.1 F-box/kelch-repeat protein At3g23880-like [Lycium ferocissimum]
MKSKRRKPTNHAQSMQDSMLKIPFLPTELITEILLRLPVKSLLQFTCVSKSWLALISSPEFVKNHLSSSSNNKDYTHHKLMLCPYSYKDSLKYCSISSLDSVTEVFDLDFPLNKNSESVSIVGSVNGLICLTIKERDNFLWNPSIRKFKKLPYSGSSLRSRYFSMYGFGYDELHDDYKVVGIRTKNNRWHHVQIYSLNSHCWRSTDDFQSGGVSFYKSGMFVNGKLHWVTCVHGVTVDNGWDIIYVNLADGKYGKVEHPYCGEGNFELKLGALGSDLSVFWL